MTAPAAPPRRPSRIRKIILVALIMGVGAVFKAKWSRVSRFFGRNDEPIEADEPSE